MESRTITSDRCIRISDEQAVLEGNLSLPYDVNDLSGVLDVSGCAEIISAAAQNEKLVFSGKARFTVLYCTRGGDLDSFDSECDFEHTLPLAEATAEMRVCASACVRETSWRISGNAISLRAILSIDAAAILPAQHSIIIAEKNDDIECDICAADTVACSSRSIKAYANSEIRIPQNMPEVHKILLARANAALKSINKEAERLIVEGELHVCLLYESTDKNAPLQFFHETLPFGEIVKDPSCTEDSLVYADLSVERISADLTEADIVSIAGVVCINTVCINKHPQDLICDLYSLSNSCETEKCIIPICYPTMNDCLKKTLRLDTQIPESAPEAARILSASSVPEITAVIFEDNQLSVDGILHITLVYSTAEAGIKSIHLKEPFDLQLGYQPDTSHIRAFSEYTAAQGSGRIIDLRIGLWLCLRGEHSETHYAVESAAFSELSKKRSAGMTVYFADDGERMWDICKKYNMPRSAAIPLDHTEDPLHHGDRVLLVR